MLASESAPAILKAARAQALLIGALERASEERIEALGNRIRVEELREERESSELCLKLLRQLKMITSLIAARVVVEEAQWGEVAKYARALVLLKRAEVGVVDRELAVDPSVAVTKKDSAL